MERIFAATDFSTRSQRALRQAGLLARQTDAQLTLLHVVDEDQPPHLIQLERKAKILNEQVSSVAELQGIHCRIVVRPAMPSMQFCVQQSRALRT